MQIYDSMTGSKRPFEKDKNETVKMYVCGPTVYDNAHLGHGRSAVAFDLVRRFLEFSGYEVDFAFNITDIDDKMINRANDEGISVPELAEKIIPEYEKDYAALGIKPPTKNPRATEFIEEMVNLIKKLEDGSHTYKLKDGIYFDITTFPDYGALSHQKMDELAAGTSIEKRDDKKNHQDFVLWKFKKEGEPFWPSPWGDGRPGWHIECSAMSTSLLGDTLDIHGGGLDLKFPHHECEIAQSTSLTAKPFARFWMHNGYITVNKEKMSKSLGNFFTLKDIFKSYHPRVVRLFLISTHYRSPIEYSTELLEQARQTLRRLDEFWLKHTREISDSVDDQVLNSISEKLSNDFDSAGAFSVLFEWMNTNPKDAGATLEEINEIFNIFPKDFVLTDEQQKLVQKRGEARKEKNWSLSDSLREELAKDGIEVEDTPEGQYLKPKI
ncbi:cysteine--tRNA ligase [Patescibacteria group bacterium]|nr:cysteine--tRNA ligase [Patescibacteria group bacterium]